MSRADRGGRATPFGPGSISIGLYSEEGGAATAVEELLRQAVAAEQHGFDGVTIAEHHGGFAGYLPDPILATSWILSQTGRAWAAACPVLLPLRPTGLVIESIAWMAARFPHRVGAGFAPGWIEDDFIAADAPFEDRRARYWPALVQASRALHSGVADGPLARDPAVAACADAPVPVVSAAAGPKGASRAARAGAGIVLAEFNSVERLRQLIGWYSGAGGQHARVVTRRVWLGTPPAGAIKQLWESYRTATGDGEFLASDAASMVIRSTSPAQLASRLADVVEESGSTALNLRVQLPGAGPEATLEQIKRIGVEVLPMLRGVGAATGGSHAT